MEGRKFKLSFRDWVILVFIISFYIYLFATFIGDYLLEKNGTCKKAVLTNEVIYFKRGKPALLYEFQINENRYDGNSNVEDLKKVGDSICIVYLEFIPGFNRPLSYYDNKIKCNCE